MLCTTGPIFAADTCQKEFVPVSDSYDFTSRQPLTLEHNNKSGRIGEVHITRLDIFDIENPDENYALYRWANRFHVTTKEDVIRSQILFRENEAYDPRLIKETERLLRGKRYIYDAAIEVTHHCGDVVNLEVITRDVWSFTPDFSYSRSGGESEYRVSLKENNLFGTGKEISVSSRSEEERDSHDLVYKDRNVNGGRVQLKTHLTDHDDGSRAKLDLNLPFYALDTRRSWGFFAEQFDQLETQYFRDEDISEVQHEADILDVFYGFSEGLVNGITRRFSLGYRYEEHNFTEGPDLASPQPFPQDRRYSYPYITFESVEDNFVTDADYDQIHRTEDIHLGRRILARMGFSATDDQRLPFDGRLTNTLHYSDNSLLQHRFDWHGFWNFDHHQIEDLLVGYQIRYFRHQTTHRNFFMRLKTTYSKNMYAEKQILLGGETGLRGYPNRYQAGDRSYLFTLEERMYTDIHLYNLLRIGWALFFDVGRAWFDNQDNGSNGGTLSNIGVGLRLAPTKSNIGQIIHLDLAFPLQKDDDTDSMQFLVTIKDKF